MSGESFRFATPILRVECQSEQPVIIEKLYGPEIFVQLKVIADFQSGCWIVYRDDSGPHGEDGKKWTEVARIEGQRDSDFDCGCEECREMRPPPDARGGGK